MKALLDLHGVWEILEKRHIKPKNDSGLSQAQKDTLRDSRKIDKKAPYLIYQELEDDASEKVS